QLILERARAGGDEHPCAREQRRYQIGKGLARASAGLDDQRFARRQRVAHALRHMQLFASHLEIGERPRERAVLTEYVLEIQHGDAQLDAKAAADTDALAARVSSGICS